MSISGEFLAAQKNHLIQENFFEILYSKKTVLYIKGMIK